LLSYLNHYEVETPKTMYSRAKTDDLMSCRSGYRTPVKGLYLCGAGSHPGGGVMGAPGRNAASVVLQDRTK
jgi:phytoene dehydrogenase-like protein